MGGETSLQYPEHFSMDTREVSLQGNALFGLTGNRERPFLIETEEVRIEAVSYTHLFLLYYSLLRSPRQNSILYGGCPVCCNL